MATMARSLNEILRFIKDGITIAQDYQPVMILGLAGTGKTESITNLAKEMGIGCKQIRLVNMSELDLFGLPSVEEEETVGKDGKKYKRKVTAYHPGKLLPDANIDGESGILILDEITSCKPTLRAAVMQLMDSTRALGEYNLPPKWKIIALGNDDGDGGIYNGMEGAVVSRAATFRVEPDFESWKKWADRGDINGTVKAFLAFHDKAGGGDKPYGYLWYKPESADDSDAFATPRTWKRVSDYINAFEKTSGGPGTLSEEDVEIMSAPFIGDDAASAFSTFYGYNTQVSLKDSNGKDITPEGVIKSTDLQVPNDAGRMTVNMSAEAIQITIERMANTYASVINDLISKASKGNPNANTSSLINKLPPESILYTANFCNFIFAMDKSEAILHAFNSARGACDAFQSLVTLSSTNKYNGKVFDQLCPRFLSWFTSHQQIFNGY